MSSSDNMLDTYLYSTDTLTDRLIMAPSHNLRRRNVAATTNAGDKERMINARVRMLEREMDKITDPTIVAAAVSHDCIPNGDIVGREVKESTAQ
ncbi:hypothetical protein CLCR_01011 [Cladophialophora carrionii]|uniref:Uncharacterized protein n=1 Tax=Cladophialophora carrionii TaxID=86049 RepID=A0A1C1D199_9EURO|nr:hypothetical protein CLCR_01011 [Cladophialophora carrionii]